VSPWDVPVVDHQPRGFGEVPEGWFALVAWAVGPGNLRRMVRPAARDAERTVQVVCTIDGRTTRKQDPFSPADRESLDESAEQTLRRCGLPVQPRGYVWFIREPEGISVQQVIRAVLTEDVQEALARDPARVADLAREAASSLYR
jgi:hypothetical protein